MTSSVKNPDISSNVFLAIMMAIANSSQNITNQQEADATSAVNYGNMEQKINQYWYAPYNPNTPNVQNLAYYINEINTLISNPNKPDGWQSMISGYQSQFQAASGQAQAAASASDSLMQTANSQASNDATNIQSINQLAQMLNIIGFIAQLMSKS